MDLVDLGCLDAGFADRVEARLAGALDQVEHQLLEVGPGDRLDEVLRTRCVGGDEGQVDLGRRGRRQLDLGLLGRFLEALQCELVLLQVDALGLLEVGCQELDDLGVEVLTAQERVATGRLHLEDAVAELEDRHVEGAAAEVINRDRLCALLVEAIGQRGRSRLVDDAQHLEARDLAGVLGRLALGVVEIGRHGDDRLRDLLAEVRFGGFLHLLQNEGADLRGAVLLAAGTDPGVAVRTLDDLVGDQRRVLLGQRITEAAADEALDGEDRVLGIGHRLALGRLTDQALLVLGEGYLARRGARAFGVLDDLGGAALHDRDAAVGGAQVDPDNFGHLYPHRSNRLRPGPAPSQRSDAGPCRMRRI